MAEKLKTYTSPKGAASYPWLNRPDTKFNPAGTYTTRLIIPALEAQEFASFLDEQFAEATTVATQEAYKVALVKTPNLPFAKFQEKVKLNDKPYKYVTDDTGEETGDIIVNFKSNASFVDKKTGKVVPLPIRLFDSTGAATKVIIGGGSTIKLAFQVVPYAMAQGMGISLRIQAVQVLSVNTFGGSTGDSFGFGKEEGFKNNEDNEFTEEAEEDEEVTEPSDEDPDF